jgi:hypothetical protein
MEFWKSRMGRLMARYSLRLGAITLAIFALALSSAAGALAITEVSDVPERSWTVNGRVRAVAVVGNTVFVGGSFTSAVSPSGETVPRSNLAAFALDTGALRRDFRADAGSSGSRVEALATDGADLFVGGRFTQVQGVTRYRIAKIGLSTGQVDATFRPVADGGVLALDWSGGALYAGGDFTTVSGVNRGRVVKLNPGSGAVDPQFQPVANGSVRAVVKNPASNTLYVAGSFSGLSGASRTGVGAVSATTGSITGPSFASSVRPILDLSINDQGTMLYGALAAGSNSATAWNTGTGTRLWRQTAMGDVQSVQYFDDRVYFGFHEGFAGNTQHRMLAADARTGAIAPSFRPTFVGFWGVFAIAAGSHGVVAGGEFTNVSGVPAGGFARFEATGSSATPVQRTYVDGGTASWSYWDGGAAPGGWQARGFNDGSWDVGRAEFGYGDGDETTVVDFGPSPTNKHITTYVRTRFQVDTIPDALSVQLTADDGAVVYVNGVEAARDNMPGGAITFSTLAATNRSGSAESAVRPFSIDPGLLVVGQNVLAIEVHQDRPSSSDLSLDADLIGQQAP